MRRRCRPFHADRAASSPHLDADRTTNYVGTQRHWYEGRRSLDRDRRARPAYRNGYATSLSLFDPAMHYTGIQPACQGDCRNGHTGLLAFANRFRLEELTVASATPTTSSNHLSHSVHVYTYRA